MLAVAVAIEDAVVLGWLLSRISSLSTLPRLLSALQEIQESRRIAAAESEDRTTSFVWLPPGPERDARDEGLRAARAELVNSHEEALLEQWEQIGAIFGYSPTEAVEDWWAKWGRMIENVNTSDDDERLGGGIDVVQETEMRLDGLGRIVQV
jgi:salicylate hydroxylase